MRIKYYKRKERSLYLNYLQVGFDSQTQIIQTKSSAQLYFEIVEYKLRERFAAYPCVKKVSKFPVRIIANTLFQKICLPEIRPYKGSYFLFTSN